MSFNELILFISYLLFCFIIAILIFNNYSFFRKAKGLITLFSIFIISVLLHNFLPALLANWFNNQEHKEEALFFIIAMLSIGTALFLTIFLLAKKIFRLIKKKS